MLRQHRACIAFRHTAAQRPSGLLAIVTYTLIALSVAFDMVTKPTSIPVALGVIAVGAILGAGLGARQRAAHSVQESEGEVVPAA